MEFGIRFGDGSVRHPWNGRTQLQRAGEELEHLRAEYPGDPFELVGRVSPGPWAPLWVYGAAVQGASTEGETTMSNTPPEPEPQTPEETQPTEVPEPGGEPGSDEPAPDQP